MLKGSFSAAFLSTTLLVVSLNSAAVQVTVNDACGKSVTVATGATTTVNSSGDLIANQVSGAAYTAGIGQCDAAAPDNRPVCTLSSSSTRVGTNTPVTLFAKCSSAPTSYTWKGPSAGPALPANANVAASISLSFPTAGAYTYSVAGANVNGTGPASTQVTVLVANTDSKPFCILTASPPIVQPNAKSTLQATCNPTPAGYVWTADANAPAVPTGAGGELTFTTTGVFTYKVKGTASVAGDGPAASATVTVDGPCTDGPTTAVVDLPQFTFVDWVALPGWVIAYRFSIATAGDYADIYMAEHPAYATYGLPELANWSISKCKGDFSPSGSCAMNSSGAYGEMYANTGGPINYGCTIEPGVQYYLNVRANSCTRYGTCGWHMVRRR